MPAKDESFRASGILFLAVLAFLAACDTGTEKWEFQSPLTPWLIFFLSVLCTPASLREDLRVTAGPGRGEILE